MKKFLLILFLGVALVGFVGGYLIYANKDKIAGVVIDKMFDVVQQEVIKNKPESMPEERITAAFANAKASYVAGEIDEHQLESVAQQLEMNMKDEVLDSAEVVQIVEGLESLAAR
jgi:hypothetical protein